MARFPKGLIFQDLEGPPPSIGRGLPECLRAPAAVVGRGVCVPLDVVRPDGARDAPKWGRWTYEYVRTTLTKSAKGESLTMFTDVQQSSLGLESQGEYCDNRPVGEWTYWHPNGRKRAVGTFSDGRMSGVWSFWREDGSPDSALGGVYENDRRVSSKPP